MSWPGSSWLGPVRTATGGILRHKVQAVAIGLVVLVTHDPALAERYAARTVRLLDGRLATAGVPA